MLKVKDIRVPRFVASSTMAAIALAGTLALVGTRAGTEASAAEAVELFNRGAHADPGCVSCLLDLAWTLSTSLDGPVPGEREAEARSALRRARALTDVATDRERALIEALAVRFDAKTQPTSGRRLRAYAEAMRKVAFAYPDDAEVQSAFAVALLSAERGSHWSADGRPRPFVREALAAANRAVRADPAHRGARSVYDHVAGDLRKTLVR